MVRNRLTRQPLPTAGLIFLPLILVEAWCLGLIGSDAILVVVMAILFAIALLVERRAKIEHESAAHRRLSD